MNYNAFLTKVNVSKESICREIYADNRDKIRIKKEETAIRNLEKIFNATLKLSNKKGFQAMSMRDFSRETGLSLGALYSYFSSKEELLEMILQRGRVIVCQLLDEYIYKEADPAERLRLAIRLHLYLSEAMQPWFYFSFMEAKNMTKDQREKTLEGELYTDEIFAAILKKGQNKGLFHARDCQQSASAIKAMLQDWYVKRWKYARRNISVDQYAEFVIDFVEAYHLAE